LENRRHVCPHSLCSDIQSTLFDDEESYAQHMRNVHNESPFPCTELGCVRVAGNGFFRKRELTKHQKTEH
jgi:hypothetical protein